LSLGSSAATRISHIDLFFNLNRKKGRKNERNHNLCLDSSALLVSPSVRCLRSRPTDARGKKNNSVCCCVALFVAFDLLVGVTSRERESK
jgi:hypothetical protein